MIRKIISAIKQSINIDKEIEIQKLETITTIEKLLSEIDFSSEEVPINDVEKLTNLLSLLKEEELNIKEIALVKEIATY